jgi:hypothetical protein
MDTSLNNLNRVNLNEVKIFPKKPVDVTPDKGKSIFEASGTKNCKDFLNTYFGNQEPK